MSSQARAMASDTLTTMGPFYGGLMGDKTVNEGASDRGVDVALAEFVALRAEIVSRSTAQSATIGLGLTAIGVIFGFVVKEGGDSKLLLAVPPLSMLLNLIFAAETYRMITIGEYIRSELWPYFERQVGPLPSWEQRVADYRARKSTLVMALVIDAPAFVVFVGSGAVALVVFDRNSDPALWAADLIFTVMAGLMPAGLALLTRHPANSAKG